MRVGISNNNDDDVTITHEEHERVKVICGHPLRQLPVACSSGGTSLCFQQAIGEGRQVIDSEGTVTQGPQFSTLNVCGSLLLRGPR